MHLFQTIYVTEYAPAKTWEYPSDIPQLFQKSPPPVKNTRIWNEVTVI